jgi:hypothetical protein
LVDERGKHLLPGHSGDTQLIGGFPLPDVERPVGRGGEVDGATGPLDAGGFAGGPGPGFGGLAEHSLRTRLPEPGEAFGGCAVAGRCGGGHLRAERSCAGPDVAGVEAHWATVPPVGANQEISAY